MQKRVLKIEFGFDHWNVRIHSFTGVRFLAPCYPLYCICQQWTFCAHICAVSPEHSVFTFVLSHQNIQCSHLCCLTRMFTVHIVQPGLNVHCLPVHVTLFLHVAANIVFTCTKCLTHFHVRSRQRFPYYTGTRHVIWTGFLIVQQQVF